MRKQSSPNCSEGFSLVEMLVALTLVIGVGAAAVTLGFSGKRIVTADEARNRLNQSLRAGVEFLSVDLRQAGELLGDDFPVIEIVNGSAGQPDELIVRRNLLPTVLRTCRDVGGMNKLIHVAEKVNVPVPSGCNEVPDDDGDGWPQNVQAWREHRLASGGQTRAFIYNPVTGDGEFFDYMAEITQSDRLIVRAKWGSAWLYDYPQADQCRLYMLEERRYRLSDGLLQMIVDQDAEAVNVADHLDQFQAVYVFRDGTQQDALQPTDTWSEIWADLRGIEIAFDGSIEANGNTIERAWATEVMPRNVMSR